VLKRFKYRRYLLSSLLTVYLLALSQYVYAYQKDPTLGQAAGNMLEPAGLLSSGMHKLFYIIGSTLILGAGLQYKNYRDNPTAVRLSTPVVLFLLGTGLILIPLISSLSPGAQALSS